MTKARKIGWAMAGSLLFCALLYGVFSLYQMHDMDMKSHELDSFSMAMDGWYMTLTQRPLAVSEAQWARIREQAGPQFARIRGEEREYIWSLVDLYFENEQYAKAFAIASREISEANGVPNFDRHLRMTIYLAALCNRADWLEDEEKGLPPENRLMKTFLKGSLALCRKQYADVLREMDMATYRGIIASTAPSLNWNWWFRWLRVVALARMSRYDDALTESDAVPPFNDNGVRNEQEFFMQFCVGMARISGNAGRHDLVESYTRTIKDWRAANPKRFAHSLRAVEELQNASASRPSTATSENLK